MRRCCWCWCWWRCGCSASSDGSGGGGRRVCEPSQGVREGCLLVRRYCRLPAVPLRIQGVICQLLPVNRRSGGQLRVTLAVLLVPRRPPLVDGPVRPAGEPPAEGGPARELGGRV